MNLFQQIFFVLLLTLASICFTYFYFLYTHEYPPGSYERIANFDADKVFQTRILITSLANLLEPTLPLLRYAFQWLIPYPINYEVLLQGITACSLFILILIIPKLCKVMGTTVSAWWGLLCFIPLSFNYILLNGVWDGAGLYYPYDIPSLTLFVAGVILVLQRKWFWFYPCFVLACLNRESACFISIAATLIVLKPSFGLNRFLNLNRDIFKHLAIQIFIWGSSRIILSFVFKDNPGVFFETPHSMVDFITCIWTDQTHWAMEKPLHFLYLFGGIWLIPLLTWKYQTTSSKKLLFVGIIYLITLCFRSNMMETRVYNELNVIITVVSIIGLSLWSKKISAEFPNLKAAFSNKS